LPCAELERFRGIDTNTNQLQLRVSELTKELQNEQQVRGTLTVDFETKLKQQQQAFKSDATKHEADWKNATLEKARQAEFELRSKLSHSENQRVDSVGRLQEQNHALSRENAVLKKEKEHLKEKMVQKQRNTEQLHDKKTYSLQQQTTNNEKQVSELRQRLAKVKLEANQAMVTSHEQLQHATHKLAQLTAKYAETESILERSERERLEVRRKYLAVGCVMCLCVYVCVCVCVCKYVCVCALCVFI
jgi:hypothetical protein